MNSSLSIAINAALRAGAEIIDVYQSEIAVELKDDRSPLTEADRRAHGVIAENLTGTGIPLLSEEGKSIPYDERRSWERFWLIDPLDGTKEFIKRNGEFTVNIALVEKGVPVLGVIYVPVKKLLYYAAGSGLGAGNEGSYRLEGVEPAEPDISDQELTARVLAIAEKGAQLLPVEDDRENYAIVASRSHLSAETEAIIAEKRKEHREVEIVSMGSSLKLCLVAEGAADLYPRLAPTMEWDTAAGHAIARYAGCRVYKVQTGEEGTQTGGDLEYNKENLLNPFFVVERSSTI